jgi:hypothetical protein
LPAFELVLDLNRTEADTHCSAATNRRPCTQT